MRLRICYKYSMFKFVRIIKSVGILIVFLMILPIIAIKSGISKFFVSHFSNGGRNKINELDKLAGSLSSVANADLPILTGAGARERDCGCGHEGY